MTLRGVEIVRWFVVRIGAIHLVWWVLEGREGKERKG